MGDPHSQSPDAPEEGALRERRPVAIKRIRMKNGESGLEQRARQVGAAAGTIVALLRDAQQRFNDSDLWKFTNPRSDLRSTAKGRARELRHAAELRAQEWRRAALERTAGLRRQARLGNDLGDEARNRIPPKRGYPLPVVAAAGVIGFLLGASLVQLRRHARQPPSRHS